MIVDKDAFYQALLPFVKSYIIKRSAIPGYNEHGRVDNTRINTQISAAIIPESKRINTNNEGMGRRIVSEYTLYCVLPNYVSMGDLIASDYGTLKVIAIPNEGFQGVIQASLVRTGTSEPSKTNPEKLYEPD